MLRTHACGLCVALISTVMACAPRPQPVAVPPPTANATVADLKEYYRPGEVVDIDADLFVSATVVAGPAGGNFFGKLVLADETGGIELRLDPDGGDSGTGRTGDRVVLRARGLAVGGFGGAVTLGSRGGDGRVGPISARELADHVELEREGTKPTAQTLKAYALRPRHYGQLVRVCGVQIAHRDTTGTFASPEDKRARNVALVDCAGNEVTLRTSGYAVFAEALLPKGNGCVAGVASAYRGEVQLRARTLADVQLTGERCVAPPTAAEVEAQRNAAAAVPRSSVTEDFEGHVAREPFRGEGWTSVGSGAWAVREYDGNGYVQASAYNSKAPSVDAWLITPAIAGDVEHVLTFRTATAYHRHDGMTVLLSTDFVPGQAPETATWMSLSARLADAETADNEWVESGELVLPATSARTHVAFRYRGSGPEGKTTTFRLDKVFVKPH